ncbi:MAG: 2,3-bisphosphoglycerate-independent phosphoglycerate mutase [Reyranella sp.]|uniref:2,3-bisphosphoglycerate-independent phosphoglycerate mutase n=1 Tax=Reyranella sp. TaxID=1929291 RepID=UPI00120B8D31|nr:2,3-bisphosphoglycerate-independent phosphoglycerate mutase [Reyranella sp.]TAJ95317.1 MAG: 2,3-bisphosphoglycerate-independent phosphoglycerate mutase [Reyranella sp.]TBR28984.1 MAG: 2,3-bisphosphoglycerate-independent phosphoglycerate mutase [Reyranella sp.]
MAAQAPRPVLLCILDGWGHRTDPSNNAILDASTPNYDRLIATCPQGLIDASETFVGLPKGQMGNSEVGHMNLGAGRVAVPDLPRIDTAIEDGSLAKNPILAETIGRLKQSGASLHLMGLASPGGVHAHQDHLVFLANLIAGQGVPVWIHAFLDGRDMPPRSALECLDHIQAGLKPGLPIRFATVAGRFYPMDRDKRWERVTLAYDAMVDARGERATTPKDAVDKAYAANLDDEFVLPTVIDGYTGMTDGDGLLMFNYRSDRAREILTALLDPRFDGFNRNRVVTFGATVGMVEYSAALNPFLKTLFPPEIIKMGLGETVSRAGLKQLRIAETEKYAHVTFFFNGGEERVFEGEERILVPSPKVKTYDLKPEMSAPEVTDKLVEAIGSGKFDLIVVNYANTDMVGHTGDLAAATKAVEAVDGCLGRLMQAIRAAGGVMFVTADHGNAEQMYDEQSHQKHTQHTLNRVPALLFNAPASVHSLTDGKLADVAPTMLALMGVPQPAEMTGTSMLSAASRPTVLAAPRPAAAASA